METDYGKLKVHIVKLRKTTERVEGGEENKPVVKQN